MRIDIKEFIKRDFWYICVTLFALLACLWTLGHTREYINECNEFWYEQIEHNKGLCSMIEMQEKGTYTFKVYNLSDEFG